MDTNVNEKQQGEGTNAGEVRARIRKLLEDLFQPPDLDEEVTLTAHVIRVEPDPDLVKPETLAYMKRCPYLKSISHHPVLGAVIRWTEKREDALFFTEEQAPAIRDVLFTTFPEFYKVESFEVTRTRRAIQEAFEAVRSEERAS